jgi:hypothetical protein
MKGGNSLVKDGKGIIIEPCFFLFRARRSTQKRYLSFPSNDYFGTRRAGVPKGDWLGSITLFLSISFTCVAISWRRAKGTLYGAFRMGLASSVTI